MESVLEPPCQDVANRSREVVLQDGTVIDLVPLSSADLLRLQCEEEPRFARAIVQSMRGSDDRKLVTAKAYQTICAILDELRLKNCSSDAFSMGMDPRYVDLAVKLLDERRDHERVGALFEVGYSSGVLLEEIAKRGYSVAGLEVVDELYDQAIRRLPEEAHGNLLVGDFGKVDFHAHYSRYDVVYWNDVFEHIPQDEILDYLKIILKLLKPGGVLVTITPNWLMRPSDVTCNFMPPRSTAIGFHLKKYMASEVKALLREAGFGEVRVPALITRSKIYDLPSLSLTSLKLGIERWVDYLPYSFAVQFCRRLGMNCTIATKPTKV